MGKKSINIPKPELDLKLTKKGEEQKEQSSFFSFLKTKENDIKDLPKTKPSKSEPIIAFPKIKLSKKETHLLEDKEVSIHEKERRLKRKEKDMYKFEKELKFEEKQWLDEQRKRNQELKKLDDEIEEEIKLKHTEWKKEHALMKQDLKALKQEVRENKILLKTEITKLSDSTAMLNKQKHDISTLQQRKQDINEALINRENKIKLAESGLSRKGSELLEKERVINKKDMMLKDSLIYINRKNDEFKKSLEETKNHINELKKQKVINQNILEDNRKFLTGIKISISREINSFRKNKNLLDNEEKSIVAKVSQIEQATKKIHQAARSKVSQIEQAAKKFKQTEETLTKNKVNLINSATKKFNHAEARLIERTRVVNEKIRISKEDQKEFEEAMSRREKVINEDKKWLDRQYKLLDDKKTQIRAVKEFKASIPVLEGKYKELQKQIAKKEQELHRTTEEAVAKWELLKDKELELKKREKNVEEGKKLLKHLQNKLIDERANLSDKEAKEYFASDIHIKEAQEEMVELKTLKAKPEIIEMIEKARFLFNNNKVNEAKDILKRVKNDFEKAKLSQKDKRKAYYDMMEIATEIKLASLR